MDGNPPETVPWYLSPTIRAALGVVGLGIVSIVHAMGLKLPMADAEAAELLAGIGLVGIGIWQVRKRIRQGKDPALPGLPTVTLTKR